MISTDSAPVIVSIPATDATIDVLYSYEVEAIDADVGYILIDRLETAAAGMTIDMASGLIQWIPSVAQIGDNSVTIQVSDAGGMADTQSFTLMVAEENTSATAVAGPDQTIQIGDMVSLDGNGSCDVDGDALTFSWSLTRQQGSTASLSDPTAAMQSFVVNVADDYIAQLIIIDGSLDMYRTQ